MMENYKKKCEQVKAGRRENFLNSGTQNIFNFMDDSVDEELDEYFTQIEKEKKVAFSGELERYLE